MSKTKAVKVNLSTKTAEVIATMREEQPKSWYYFMKTFGGKRKYMKVEDAMLDKALEEEKDQLSDMNYYISPVGNRWISYTHVRYYPKAKYANAFHYSFIYYETYESCGAFFPMYSPKQTKGGVVKKGGKPDEMLLFTDHFFYRLSDRSKKKYRSKDMIREFMSQRCENVLSADDEGDVIAKFTGGHGFGKETGTNPRRIEIRTYLGDDELTSKQRKKCEMVDAFYELTKDGMTMTEVAQHTVYHTDYTSKEVMEDGLKKLKAMKRLGMEEHLTFVAAAGMGFINILEDILGKKIPPQKMPFISNLTGVNFIKLAGKYIENGKYIEYDESVLMNDLIDAYTKSAKDIGLKRITREQIKESFDRISNK